MKMTMFLPFKPDRSWELACQAGVSHAVVKLAPELTGWPAPWNIDVLAESQNRFRRAGLHLIGLEGDPFDMSRIKLGLEGRDEDICHYQQLLENMGQLDIPLLCYNFMAGIGWYRSQTNVRERGGAITSAFNNEPYYGPCHITEEKVRENYRYFIKRIIPTAEKAGVVMGLHPDDPPVPSLKGYGRFLYSASAFDWAMSLSDSPAHQITFCQANFFAMGENVPELLRRWKKRIAFVHFRDIRGQANSFVETFHDNGDHDMNEVIETLLETGFNGPIRTDHAPGMAGEGSASGYEILGHLFAMGYLRGLIDAHTNNKEKQ